MTLPERQTVNVGFGAQAGYDIGSTLKAGGRARHAIDSHAQLRRRRYVGDDASLEDAVKKAQEEGKSEAEIEAIREAIVDRLFACTDSAPLADHLTPVPPEQPLVERVG